MLYFEYQLKRVFYKETGNGKPLIMLHGVYSFINYV